MNAGAYIPPFIEELTGISNAMVRKAPPAAEVMCAVTHALLREIQTAQKNQLARCLERFQRNPTA